MSSTIPELSSLAEIYDSNILAKEEKRWERLRESFGKVYGAEPAFVARSPGRVNLIGEHVDYSNFPCLPMAISVDVLLAVQPISEPKIYLANVSPEKFEKREFDIPANGHLQIDHTKTEWSNYFKAGLRSAVTQLEKVSKRPKGMKILVDGTVPTGGGLSSSAAFVCASALASLVANGEKDISKRELTELAVASERFVGVNSGGMDQSASIFGVKGSALFIQFKPSLSATPIAFPSTEPELAFVIVNTLVDSVKHLTAPVNYNLRVVECTLAAVILSKKFGVGDLPQDGPLGATLHGFLTKYYEKNGKSGEDVSPNDMAERLTTVAGLTNKTFTKSEGYTREEMAELIGVDKDSLVQKYMTQYPVRAEKFQLRKRALHVLEESLRVIKYRQLLTSPPGSSQELYEQLGKLMNESQDSCRNQYQCSCPELDQICALARKRGAAGSRLTGAGWGGFTVSLIWSDQIQKFVRAITREYFVFNFPNLAQHELEDAIVVSKPSLGSAFIRY